MRLRQHKSAEQLELVRELEMPGWRNNLVVLAVSLGVVVSQVFGQYDELARKPMPVSNATASPSSNARSFAPYHPPLRVAQTVQPFDSNSPPTGFRIPSATVGTNELNSTGAQNGIGLPSSSAFPAANPVGVPGAPAIGPTQGQVFQPWSPTRPPDTGWTSTGPGANALLSPTNGPAANGLGTSIFIPDPGPTSSGIGNPAPPTMSRFGMPPQGFDPGYTPEVQIADLTVNVTPSTQSLNYFAGLGFNSDQGVFGRLSYDDRDFDWTAVPWRNPPIPFRGGGQRLRIEAMPGSQVQRYLVTFDQPFFSWFGGKPVSFHLSGHYFERDYYDWDERRTGGRFGFGYGINSALSLQTKFTIENVDISDPRILVPELQRSLGDHERYAGAINLIYDTRDIPYAPSSGTYLELGFEQIFGSFDYPRGTVDYRRYQMMRERPDRSGRHILGLTFKGVITGNDTPIYDNLFAGGYGTLRGFRFRHASPKNSDVIVGGELSLTGSAEYYFPVTADDMIRAVLFSDVGTISEDTSIHSDDLRVSVGGGLRVYIPALGPAPLSIDAAVPVVRADTDRVQNIHFYVNLGF